MKLFSSLYEKTMQWSRHRHAPWYLGGLSFAESSFFPIPPDVMLAPMSMAKPEKAMWLALLTTLTSVAGGVLGYMIGLWGFDLIEAWLAQSHYQPKFVQAQEWFTEWGVWAIFIAGFSPIPYKIFTITAGVLSMAFLPFVIASFLGRGARFFLVAKLMAWGGPAMEQTLSKWVDRIGWGLVVLLVFALVLYKL